MAGGMPHAIFEGVWRTGLHMIAERRLKGGQVVRVTQLMVHRHRRLEGQRIEAENLGPSCPREKLVGTDVPVPDCRAHGRNRLLQLIFALTDGALRVFARRNIDNEACIALSKPARSGGMPS